MRTPLRLYEADDLLVVDKPSGWVVHAARPEDQAVDLLRWAGRGLHPGHRIDKGTSGLVLLAKSKQMAQTLGEWFAAQQISKRYQALVHGIPHKKGIVRQPLVDGGTPREAVTRFRVVERFRGVALLAIRPQTGRKHQIRRHLQHIGHSVVGDRRYRPRKPRKVPGAPDRLCLHAGSIELPDGRVFEAPLPDELQAYLTLLRG